MYVFCSVCGRLVRVEWIVLLFCNLYKVLIWYCIYWNMFFDLVIRFFIIMFCNFGFFSFNFFCLIFDVIFFFIKFWMLFVILDCLMDVVGRFWNVCVIGSLFWFVIRIFSLGYCLWRFCNVVVRVFYDEGLVLFKVLMIMMIVLKWLFIKVLKFVRSLLNLVVNVGVSLSCLRKKFWRFLKILLFCFVNMVRIVLRILVGFCFCEFL